MRTDGTATLDHYLKPVLEHKNLIVAVTGITAVLAVVASVALPASYRSTASVLLTPISGNPLTPLESDTDVDMATELLISTSKAVVARVSDDLATQSMIVDPDMLADNVAASSPPDSKVLDLVYEASTPEQAQIIANSFAVNYLEYREQIATESRAEAVDALNERIALLKEQLSDIEGRLSQMEAGTQPYVSLSVERDSVDSELQAQQEALAALSTLSLSAGEILSPAQLPLTATGPGLITLLAGGLAGGLVIGVVLAMLVSAIRASLAPRNRRASDRIEHNRRQGDRFQIGGRRASDNNTESAVEKLARVTAGRRSGDEPDRRAGSTSTPDPADNLDDAAETSDADEAPAATTEPGQSEQRTAKAEPQPETPPPATTTNPEPEQPPATTTNPEPEQPPATTAQPEPNEQPAATTKPQPETPPAATTKPEPARVVHSGTPPPPPSTARKTPAATAEDPVAAHFGADVPPPPRNKAKIRDRSDPPPPAVDGPARRATDPPPREQNGSSTPNLEAEAGLDRVVGEIGRYVADGPVACLAIGQTTRDQSIAAGFALVDGLKTLNIDVLIVDALIDDPVLTEVLDLPDGPGLSEVLVDQVSLDSVIQPLEDFNRLFGITTGGSAPLARSAFDTSRIGELLGEAKSRFPVTVILGGVMTDAAFLVPAGGGIDGLIVATAAPPGDPADPSTVEHLRSLGPPVWTRVSTTGRTDSDQTATTATTTV